MPKFVRVRTESGAEATTTEAYAKLKKLTVLSDKPATDANGRGLAAKPKRTVEEAAASKKKES